MVRKQLGPTIGCVLLGRWEQLGPPSAAVGKDVCVALASLLGSGQLTAGCAREISFSSSGEAHLPQG